MKFGLLLPVTSLSADHHFRFDFADNNFLSSQNLSIYHDFEQYINSQHDNIIDETYDNVYDANKRYKMALEQVRFLCHQSQEQVLEKIKPIVLHNYHRIMDYDWEEKIKNLIQDLFKKANN
jgi:hypothetical protein